MSDTQDEIQFRCDVCARNFDPDPSMMLSTYPVYKAGQHYEAGAEPDGAVCICLACQTKIAQEE